MTAITPSERFESAFNDLIEHEGGYSNHPNDPGGATKYGITQKDVNQYWAALNLPKDVKNLTLDNARVFYKYCYWDMYHYEAINFLPIAKKIFDMAVNLGAPKAHKITQESCNSLGSQLIVDGLFGGKTIGAVNELCHRDKQNEIMNELCTRQKDFYELLVGQHPKLKVFLKGWLTRAAYQGS